MFFWWFVLACMLLLHWCPLLQAPSLAHHLFTLFHGTRLQAIIRHQHWCICADRCIRLIYRHKLVRINQKFEEEEKARGEMTPGFRYPL
ncbi:hypothetical protein BJ165DRAFT_1483627 [Panaeolus papilionaceus]|nr:hypothetical protein BJ165DRAFT_1483627 [Panaeolus papilionaceus]